MAGLIPLDSAFLAGTDTLVVISFDSSRTRQRAGDAEIAGRRDFDTLLQSKSGAFRGGVSICDTTTWSSTAGGLENLRRFWRNVALR